jgi:mannose-6-phosphate isomerase-like protein (cupin superfamily)
MAHPGQVVTDPATGTRIAVLKTSAETGGKLLQFEETYPQGRGKEANAPHLHLTFDERFEVVEGRAAYVVSGAKQLAEAGATVVIPRGAAHLNPYNAGDVPLKLIHSIALDPPNARTLESFENAFDTIGELARRGKLDQRRQPKSFLQFALILQSLHPHSYAAGVPIPAQRAMLGILGGLGRLLGYRSGMRDSGPASEYHFLDKWFIPHPIDIVFEALLHGEEYPRWWGEAWKRVTPIGEGAAATVGAKTEVIAGGFLPYTITLELEIARVERPYTIAVMSRGDLEGTGTWRLHEFEGGTAVSYDWRVRAGKPLIRRFSPIFKPLFRANHNWVMRRGEVALRRWLANPRRERPTASAPSVQS